MGASCTTVVNKRSLRSMKKMADQNGSVTEVFKDVDTGFRQSPINIDTSLVMVDPKLNRSKPLKIVYPNSLSNLVIINTGYGWKLDIPEMMAAKTELCGGPLKGHIYRIAQFHCHWGPDMSIGSEHTVNGRSYSAELHFVHWNTSIYSTPVTAASEPYGLAVLAVFIDIGYQVNKELNKVLMQIDDIIYKGDKKLINEGINIELLMPTNKSYWTYQGSLTTPPLFESVTWIIYNTPIYGTVEQIAKFRQLIYTDRTESMFGGRLVENYRRTQPLNGRTVQFVKSNIGN